MIHVLKIEVKETIMINDIKFCVNILDSGGKFYTRGQPYKELASPLYRLIQDSFAPDLVIDVGANYGFISMICAKYFPEARIVAIEPDLRLCKYIKQNAKLNNYNRITVIRAICDQVPGKEKTFALNPLNSQDNRVKAPSKNWKTKPIETVSIDHIFNIRKPSNFAFIKTDTQGYECEVLFGAEEFLQNNSNWLMKMEFFPCLLVQQGTSPGFFLEYLISHYDVVDLH